PATVMPSGADKPAAVVIRDSDLSRACAALAAGLDRSWRVVPLDAPDARARKVRTSRLAKAAARRSGFRLFRQVPAPVGPTMGEHVGVDVEVWAHVRTRTAGAGPAAAEDEATLVAQRRQTWI